MKSAPGTLTRLMEFAILCSQKAPAWTSQLTRRITIPKVLIKNLVRLTTKKEEVSTVSRAAFCFSLAAFDLKFTIISFSTLTSDAGRTTPLPNSPKPTLSGSRVDGASCSLFVKLKYLKYATKTIAQCQN